MWPIHLLQKQIITCKQPCQKQCLNNNTYLRSTTHLTSCLLF